MLDLLEAPLADNKFKFVRLQVLTLLVLLLFFSSCYLSFILLYSSIFFLSPFNR